MTTRDLIFRAVAAGADLRYGSCNGAYKGTELSYIPRPNSAAKDDIDQVTDDVLAWWKEVAGTAIEEKVE